jgi:hypothetical protein
MVSGSTVRVPERHRGGTVSDYLRTVGAKVTFEAVVRGTAPYIALHVTENGVTLLRAEFSEAQWPWLEKKLAEAASLAKTMASAGALEKKDGGGVHGG